MVPVFMVTIFLAGLVAIQKLQKWALQVTEGLVFLLFAAGLTAVAMLLAQNWPAFYANPEVPLALTAASGTDGNDVRP